MAAEGQGGGQAIVSKPSLVLTPHGLGQPKRHRTLEPVAASPLTPVIDGHDRNEMCTALSCMSPGGIMKSAENFGEI